MTDQSADYRRFLNSLAATIDEAQLAGLDKDGIAHLIEASEFFWSDYRILQHTLAENAARDPSISK